MLMFARSIRWMQVGAAVVAVLIAAHERILAWTYGQLPTFASSSDARLVDVVVLDRNRQPVHGLTEEDFEVFEDGTRRRTLGVSEVSLPGPTQEGAEWTREIGPDVSSNDVQGRRLVVLVLDDASTGARYGEPFW